MILRRVATRVATQVLRLPPSPGCYIDDPFSGLIAYTRAVAADSGLRAGTSVVTMSFKERDRCWDTVMRANLVRTMTP